MNFFKKAFDLVMYLGFYMLIGWLFKSSKSPQQDPQALQAPPSAKQGDPIRVVGGRYRIEASNCVWHGDVTTTAVKAKGSKKG